MPTFKLTIAYDGTNYSGWQLQPDRPTVQGEVERALAKITQQQVRVTGSSRTDTGVHALGQVVSFTCATRLDAATIQRALNHELPDDIAVYASEIVPDDFHAIRDAKRKRYRYLIQNHPVRNVFALRYSWHYWERLDAEAMQQAAQHLVGEHDFKSFENQGTERETSVRRLFEVTVCRGGEGSGIEDRGSRPGDGPHPLASSSLLTPRSTILLEIEGNGFLYNMVRNIVGTLVEVGRGARDEAWVREVLAACDRTKAGQTAPPQGLFLLWVEY